MRRIRAQFPTFQIRVRHSRERALSRVTESLFGFRPDQLWRRDALRPRKVLSLLRTDMRAGALFGILLCPFHDGFARARVEFLRGREFRFVGRTSVGVLNPYVAARYIRAFHQETKTSKMPINIVYKCHLIYVKPVLFCLPSDLLVTAA